MVEFYPVVRYSSLFREFWFELVKGYWCAGVFVFKCVSLVFQPVSDLTGVIYITIIYYYTYTIILLLYIHYYILSYTILFFCSSSFPLFPLQSSPILPFLILLPSSHLPSFLFSSSSNPLFSSLLI